MDIYSEYGLSTVKDIPKWIARIPFLRRLWFNPVFQRNYRNSRVRKLVEPRAAFWIGFVWSFILSTIMVIVSAIERDDLIIGYGSMFIVALFGFVYVITYLRMFFHCLIATPRELQHDIRRENPSMILTAPISSASLFFAEILPNFVRGLEVLYSSLTMLLGIALPYIPSILLSFTLNAGIGISDVLAAVAYTIPVVIIIIVAFILMMLLTSIVTGTYAITNSITASVLASLFHSYIVLNLTAVVITLAAYVIGEVVMGFFENRLYNYYESSDFGHSTHLIVLTLILTAVGSMVVIWACLMTSHTGISTLAKVRREGFYKPEMSNAAGLEW